MANKWVEIAINVLFWAVTASFFLLNFSITSQEIELINGVETIRISRNENILWQLALCIVLSVALFYTNLRMIGKLKYGPGAGRLFLQSVGLFALFLIGALLINHYLRIFSGPRLSGGLITGALLFYYVVSVTYGMAKVWLKTETQRQHLALEKKQAELTLLRARLHPHFLFNVLNNLLSMVDQDRNPVLAESIDRLSGLLRYVVYETANDRVPVSKEIEFIRHYSQLQLLRFEADEINFDLKVKGDHNGLPVEPGLFIPFIENAFKYGAAPERRSRIEVVFDLSSHTSIFFTVTNPILHRKISSGGSGIASTKARLQLVYPKQHRLKITKHTFFKVELQLDIHESDNSR